MAEFLVELYVSRSDPEEAVRRTGRVRVAAEELTREGTTVRCVRSIFVPEDETCFVLCEAASAAAVHETARRAALTFERVAEAVASSESQEVQLCP